MGLEGFRRPSDGRGHRGGGFEASLRDLGLWIPGGVEDGVESSVGGDWHRLGVELAAVVGTEAKVATVELRLPWTAANLDAPRDSASWLMLG